MWGRDDRDLLKAVHHGQFRLLRMMGHISNQLERLMPILDDLESEVANQTTVVSGVETVVGNINKKLQDAIDALAASGADTTRLQAIADAIKANDTRLGALVAANTEAPAVPVPEPVVTPEPTP